MTGSAAQIADLTTEQRKSLLARLREKTGKTRQQAGAGTMRAIERPQHVPLSFGQMRLWFLHHLDSHNSAYHLSTVLRLTGELNIRALSQTLGEVMTRHEILRTRFPIVEGRPIQSIAAAEAITLPIIDLSSLSDERKSAEHRRLVDEESDRPFDICRGPALRYALLKLGAGDHIALLVMHHIISDGWSEGVLIREVAVLYDSFSRNRPSTLPEPRIQYADFAIWQRQRLEGEMLESQLAYWKKQLSGAPAILELPTDKPRPAEQTFRGAQKSIVLSSDLHAKLNKLGLQAGVTLFMILLAAFQTLLSRYTNQEDVSVGTPMSGRSRLELEGLIGFFVNTLVLRTDLSGNPGFVDLLKRVREVTLAAYANNDLPFERLVDELQLGGDLRRTPLFQVMFVMRNPPRESFELPALTIGALGAASATAKFDLTLVIDELPQGLVASFGYSTDLFEEATIERMTRHFDMLLTGIVADPQQPIWSIPIITEAERRQALKRH